MNKYDKLWHNINNLLSHLRAFDAVNLVDTFYQKYGNGAPAWVLRKSMEDLQKHLDGATTKDKKTVN